MNSQTEAVQNGLMQIGTLQSNVLQTIYDPTHGFISDAIEVGWNYAFGNTMLKSGNIRELNTFANNLSQAIDVYEITNLKAVGHSGGGDRLYLGVLLGSVQLNSATDDKGNAIKPFADIAGYDKDGPSDLQS